MSFLTNDTTLGVLRGGAPTHFSQSLQTGQYVLDNARDAGVQVEDILIDTSGTWHLRGRPVAPHRALDQIDAVYNALHDSASVYSALQRIAEARNIPYTGPSTPSMMIGNATHLARRYVTEPNIRHLPHRVLHKNACSTERLEGIFHSILGACVVRPASNGQYAGVSVVETYEDMAYAVAHAYEYADIALVEQHMGDILHSVIVFEEYRGETYYAFPPVQTHTAYNTLQENTATHEHAAALPAPTRALLLTYARAIHQMLHMRGNSQMDFVVRPEGIYFLQAHPTLALGDGMPARVAFESTHTTPREFIEHVQRSLFVG